MTHILSTEIFYFIHFCRKDTKFGLAIEAMFERWVKKKPCNVQDNGVECIVVLRCYRAFLPKSPWGD